MRLLLGLMAPLALIACSTVAPAPAPTPAVIEAPSDPRPTTHPLIGKAIPDFSAPLLGGGNFTQETLDGEWTVVMFWGLGCQACMDDALYADALNRAIGQDPDLEFVSVHVDGNYGGYASVDAFFQEKGWRFTTALDGDRALWNAFQMQWAPSYLVIGPDKVVRGFRTDLNRETRSQGGVKAFLQDIHEMKKRG